MKVRRTKFVKARNQKSKNKVGNGDVVIDSASCHDSDVSNLCVGVVVGAQGLNGVVRIKSYTNTPAGIIKFNELVDENGVPVALHLVRMQKGIVIARITGVSDRTEAESWIGKNLYVARSVLPKLERDEYYHTDLVGLRVESPKGIAVGRVIAVYDFGAGGIIDIEKDDGESENIMLPFTAEAVPLIDISNSYLVVAPDAFEAHGPES